MLGLAIMVIVAAIAIYAVNTLMFRPRYVRRDAITEILNGVSRAIYVYSDSFNEGAQISSEYTCDVRIRIHIYPGVACRRILGV